MKRCILFLICTAAVLLCGCQSPALAQQLDELSEIVEQLGPLPTVTPSPTPAAKAADTPTPSPSASPTPTPAPTEKLLVTPRPLTTIEPSSTPVPSQTPKLSAAPTPTATPEPTVAPEPTFTPYPSWMMAPTPGSIPYSPTPAPTAAPVPTPAQVGEAKDTDTPSATYATGQEVADFALQYVGYQYKWAGTSPETGFDCSGFVYYVYQQFGYELNRTAAAQAGNGSHVEADSLEPGDVLCFYKGSYIGHSGIYIGNGEYVHAQDSATGVVVSPLSERTGGFEARRILSE